MASTTFIAGTVIDAAWLNEVNTETFLTDAQRLARLGLSEPEGASLIGYETDGDGASGLTVQAELRRRVNVVSHGADPTGTDDSAQAFRDAISAAGGGTVYVPPGTYKVLTAVEITSGVTILGEGATINSSTSQITIFSVLASDVTLVGLHLVGGGNTAYDTNGRLVSASGTDNGATTAPTYIYRLRILDCTFDEAGRAGLRATFVDQLLLERCSFTNIAYAAVEFLSCSHVVVSSCYIKDITPGTSSNTYGIYFSRTNAADLVRYPPSAYGIVRDCYLENIEWEGIDCHGIDGFLVEGNTLVNCGDTNVAIALISGDDETSTPIVPVTNTRVVGNYIYNNNDRAIALDILDGSAILHRNVVIADNTIESVGRPTSGSSLFGGISVASVVNCSVTGNVLTGVSPYGIMVRGADADNVTISGNAIERAYSTANTAPAGIIVDRGASAGGTVTIVGNVLTSRVMSPPDAYQNVYGVRVAGTDTGLVRVGPNDFSTATTAYSGDLGQYGSSAFAVANHGTATIAVTFGSGSATLNVTLENVYSSNTTYNVVASINSRVGAAAVVEASRVSTSEIQLRVYPASGTFTTSGNITVYWQTMGF